MTFPFTELRRDQAEGRNTASRGEFPGSRQLAGAVGVTVRPSGGGATSLRPPCQATHLLHMRKPSSFPPWC